MKSVLSAIFKLIPPEVDSIYKVCNKYVMTYRNENNDEIRSNGEYWLASTVLSKSKVVFDVGANKGDFARICLQINPSINVHCFEPSKNTFKRLLSNKFPANVICNNFGLGSEKKEEILHIYGQGEGTNSIHKRFLEHLGAGVKDYEKIVIDTVDTYCNLKKINEIDFIKIDVEGFELEVIKGSKDMIKRGKIKIIMFEYGGTYIDARILLKDFFELFEVTDYSFYKLYPNKLKLFKKYDPLVENFQYANWVIIHNSVALNNFIIA